MEINNPKDGVSQPDNELYKVGAEQKPDSPLFRSFFNNGSPGGVLGSNQGTTDETTGYYQGGKHKAGDFAIGLFGCIGICVVGLYSPVIVSFVLNLSSTLAVFVGYLIPIVLSIVWAVWAFKHDRRFIGIGVISALSVILLLFGACLWMISQIHG